MAGFVQIIEYQSNKADEMRKVADEFWDKTAGKRKVKRVLQCADRDQAGRYFTIAVFDSYEDAMKNNELPETNQIAAAMQALADGPPTFYNLDVEVVRED